MAWKAVYEGRNFKKSGGKPTFVGKVGNKGIPPESPKSLGKQSKAVEFVGSRGDKGVGCASAKAGSSKAPRD